MTPSKGFIGAPSEGGVGVLGIIWIILGKTPDVFTWVTRSCILGDSRVWAGAISVDYVCVVLVGLGAMLSIVVPKMVAISCNASP